MASRSSRDKVTAPADWTPPDPNRSPIPGATPFQVAKPVNLPQLEAEIATALGVASVTSVLVGPQDGSLPLSAENYYVLWLMPSSADQGVVYQAISDHTPNPNWGVSSVARDFDAVWAKLLDNPEAPLGGTEQEQLLRGLAFRVMTARG